MKKKLIEGSSFFNIFNKHIGLTYNNKEYFQTIYGFFLSIIFYIVVITLLVICSQDLIFKINPKYHYYEVLNKDKKLFLYEVFNDFSFSLEAKDLSENETNKLNDLITFELRVNSIVDNKAKSYFFKNLLKLNNKFTSKNSNIFLINKTISLSNSQIMGLDNIEIPYKNFTAEINHGDFISFHININDGIKSEKIKELKSNIKITDYALNLQDYKDPYIPSYSKFDINFDSITKYFFMYEKVQIKDDDGVLIHHSYSKEKKHKIKMKNFSLVPYKKESPNSVEVFSMGVYDIRKNYIREYKKIYQLIEELICTVNFLMIVGKLMVIFLNNKSFEFDFVNRLFSSDIEEGLKNKEINFHNTYLKIFSDSKLNRSESDNQDYKIIKNNKNEINSKSVEGIKNESPFEYNDCKQLSFDFNFNVNNLINNIDEKNKAKSDEICIEKVMENSLKEKVESKATDVEEIENKYEKVIPKERNHLDRISSFNKKYENYLFFQGKENIENLKKFNKSQNKSDSQKPPKYYSTNFLYNLLICKRFKSKSQINKEKIYKQLYQKLFEQMDLKNYNMIFENIAGMKKIIFNDNQLIAFDHLKIRNISEFLGIEGEEENLSQKFISNYDYFYRRSKEEQLDQIDVRLLLNSKKDFLE